MNRDPSQLLLPKEVTENLRKGMLKYQSLVAFTPEVCKKEMNHTISTKSAKFKLTTSGEVRIASLTTLTLEEERAMSSSNFRSALITYAHGLEKHLDMGDGNCGQITDRVRESLAGHLKWCLFHTDAEGDHEILKRYSEYMRCTGWQEGHHNYDYSHKIWEKYTREVNRELYKDLRPTRDSAQNQKVKSDMQTTRKQPNTLKHPPRASGSTMNKLLCMICRSVSHTFNDHSHNKPGPHVTFQDGKWQDKNGQGYCIGFNSSNNCSTGAKCQYKHACSRCGATDHNTQSSH